MRLSGVREGAGRVVYGDGAARSPVRGTGARARGRRERDIRAGRAHCLAYPPAGQNLIVIAGCGWAQREGGPVQEIRPGDLVRFAPGEKHWHGATASNAMTHIAVQEKLDGKAVEWLEKVSEEEYHAPEAP